MANSKDNFFKALNVVVLAHIAVCVRPSASYAGAYMQPSGHGQIIISTRFETSDRYFDSSGLLRPVRDYRKFELHTLLEYGLTETVTLILAPSATRLKTSVPANPVLRETLVDDTYGHLEAGARFQLYKAQAGIFSIQATVRAGQRFSNSALRLVREDRTEYDVRLLYGRNFGFGGWQGFVDLQTGYRFRASVADEWHTDLTAGLHLQRGWMLLLQNFNTVTFGRTFSKTWPGVIEPAKRSHKVQASLVYNINTTWSIQAGAFTTLAARNARRDKGLVTAVWKRF